ncbi:MAG: DedA family protein [Castellaniella sp.]|nr:DedA family protein [Castellaniella sp.]
MDVAGLIHSYGYLAVAAGTLAEGETVLLAAAAAAAHGYLHLPLVIAIASICGFLGDQAFFLIGRIYGIRVLARFPSMQPRIGRAQALLERHHILLILAVRFMYGLRTAGPMAIGMSGVHWLRFLTLNFIGAILWACLVGGIGYGLGHGALTLLHQTDADELWGLAIAVLLLVVWWALFRRHRCAQQRKQQD